MSEKFKKELIEWIKVIATALVFAFIITQFIRPTLVRGESMYIVYFSLIPYIHALILYSF